MNEDVLRRCVDLSINRWVVWHRSRMVFAIRTAVLFWIEMNLENKTANRKALIAAAREIIIDSYGFPWGEWFDSLGDDPWAAELWPK